jgi:hypothetical protein
MAEPRMRRATAAAPTIANAGRRPALALAPAFGEGAGQVFADGPPHTKRFS